MNLGEIMTCHPPSIPEIRPVEEGDLLIPPPPPKTDMTMEAEPFESMYLLFKMMIFHLAMFVFGVRYISKISVGVTSHRFSFTQLQDKIKWSIWKWYSP